MPFWHHDANNAFNDSNNNGDDDANTNNIANNNDDNDANDVVVIIRLNKIWNATQVKTCPKSNNFEPV